MSVSVHPILPVKPINRFDFGSRMDSAAAKFTAVNGSLTGKETPKSFTFRPDPTASFATNGNAASSDSKEPPQSAPQSGYGTEASSSRHTDDLPDAQGFYDNINVGKRKRSPEDSEEDEEEERQSSMSVASPMEIQREVHGEARADVESTGPSPANNEADAGDSHTWTERPHNQSQAHSPDEAHLAESLKRDMARQETGGPQVPGAQSVVEDLVNRAKSKMSKTPPKRLDEHREHKKRAFTHRTKTGCMTCRKRKKKCDEHKPVCLNCTKGSFKCEGYEEDKIVHGASSPHPRGRASTHSSIASNIQPYPVTRPNWTDHYDQYRTPTSPETRRSSDLFANAQRDSWGKPLWPQEASPSSQQAINKVPHTEPPRSDSFLTFPREPPRLSHESLINAARLGTSIAPAAGPGEAKAGPLIPQPRAPMAHTSPLGISSFRQRQRMLQGLPYHHFNDLQLIDDRNECKAALERYNNATRQSQGASEEECGRLFKAIVIPELRRLTPSEGRPSGTLGRYVVIEAPFSCEYGYNIHLDDDVVVEANCYIQDPCRVTVGKRSVIGPDVKIYGRVLPTDMRARGGLRGLAIGAPVTIEDDCYIGGSCVIMAGVRIGRGSVISAGTTVDKDVPSGVEFGGCPPKIIRGISLPSDNNNHNPHRHDLDDVASLMMKERGYTLTGR
ncbi:trimeric LpxA-like protein [Myriangium duriaei CBS 260.36]|uniref:Trimeric LpxA-like protein n=1 Tax=Myriangium duriaei CBS 260.36 TaxID=1168546 RepID=A0A9P4J8X3_9PEZI|nr:trimeric LpxA-like protein [Myriangium duriaei CBS 260.36]